MVQWTQSLSVGVREVDEQHKELFRRIDQLIEAMRHGKGRTEINGVVSFLEDYVVTHFRDEEALMLANSYPGYAEHKAQHEGFTEMLTTFKRGMDSGSVSVTVIQVHTNVVQWLSNHIAKSDRALGTFLKSAERKAA